MILGMVMKLWFFPISMKTKLQWAFTVGPNFNTRKITVAKKWLKEYLAN